MTKLIRLTYNEYGAPEQENPKWADLVSWMFNRIASIFYRLNGGVEKVNNGSRLDRITFWFWTEAYAWGDLQCYSWIKGYRQELPHD